MDAIGRQDMHKNDYQKKRARALPDYISIISPNNYARIKIEDIETVEQDGRKILVKTVDKNYSFYGTISTLAECLAERAFFRPLKSVIINLDQVRDISGFTVNFHSGQSVALGRNAMQDTKRAYKRYLLRYPPYTVWEPILSGVTAVSEKRNEYEN